MRSAALGTAAAAAPGAQAAGRAPVPRANGGMRFVLDRFDRDGDGRLDMRAEFAEAAAAVAADAAPAPTVHEPAATSPEAGDDGGGSSPRRPDEAMVEVTVRVYDAWGSGVLSFSERTATGTRTGERLTRHDAERS